MSNDREKVDANTLLDFILKSALKRFILFKFVEFHRLKNEKIDEFIKYIEEEEKNSIYLEYIPFNLLIIKEMKHKYEVLSNQFKESQEEIKQTKTEFYKLSKKFEQNQDEFLRTQKELTQTKEELTQTQKELTQTKEELKQTKDDLKNTKESKLYKQIAHTMMVGGDDEYNMLGESPNKEYDDYSVIHPPLKSSIDPSSLLSFSTYSLHSVQVTRNGKLLGIGDNRNGQISDSLSKTEITEFTEFSIRDRNGRQLDPVSAVCSKFGTLYMFSSGNVRQLVLCDRDINGGHPVFLDIGDEQPVSLFGGCIHSAAITNKGEVIFINGFVVKELPESKIKSVCLPDGEKAVSVACCDDSVVALSSNGRVFLSAVQSESSVLNFSTVSELSGQEIVWVSGILQHFLAVSREGRVFGRGSNSYGELGLGQQTSEISSFTEISSLNGHKIRAAYAGECHSLFETREGKILACGSNYFSELLLSSDSREEIYSPIETTITESATFCIAGNCLSAVFIGGDPPPNTPNKLIEKE